MDKRSVLVVSLLSLLVLFSLRGYAEPTYTYNQSQLITTYTPTGYSNFSITWNDSSENVNAYLENNFSVSLANWSMQGTYPTFTNSTSVLAAGVYQYRFVANSSGNENSTPILYFTISKAATNITLYLNGTQENMTYTSNDTANFTVILNVSGNINLTSNYTGWVNQSELSSPLYYYPSFYSVGNWSYLTASFDGNENYTASSPITYYFNVTDATPPVPSSIGWSTNTAGSSVTFSTLLTDNAGLSGYVFSFDNCIGSFMNESWIPMTGLTNWSYVIKTINSTAGCTINFKVYAKDTSNYWSVSSNSFITKYNDGSSCTDNIQCPELYCLHNVCRPSSPWCGDTICDSGETCSSCPTDCGSCTSTTSSSGSNTPTGSFLIKDLASSLAISQGESKSAQFTLSNTLSNNIANVSFSVSGIDSSWYTLSKSSISILAHGTSQAMTITFNIPNNAEAKDYVVTISAKGKALGETTSRIATKTMTLTVNSSQPQPIQPLPSETVSPQETAQQNETANITSNQTSVVTGLAPAFEFFKNNLVIIIAVAACLLIFMFRNNLTTSLTGTIGKEEPETHKAKSASFLKGIKDRLDYKLIVNLKKESKAKSLKEPTEVQGAEKIPEMVPEKQPKRPAVLEKEIKRDINELQSILEAEKKVGKNKKKFNLGNN